MAPRHGYGQDGTVTSSTAYPLRHRPAHGRANHPEGLPPGAREASLAISACSWVSLTPRHRMIGCADGMPPHAQPARSMIAARKGIEKHLTQNQMFDGQVTAG
jgi:hypothetical protein